MNGRLPFEYLLADAVVTFNAVEYVLPERFVIYLQRSPPCGELHLPRELAVTQPACAVVPAALYYYFLSRVAVLALERLVAFVINLLFIFVEPVDARRVEAAAFAAHRDIRELGKVFFLSCHFPDYFPAPARLLQRGDNLPVQSSFRILLVRPQETEFHAKRVERICKKLADVKSHALVAAKRVRYVRYGLPDFTLHANRKPRGDFAKPVFIIGERNELALYSQLF